MKSMGRRHRPFFRICATDSRTPRDGRTIEELGHYDPMNSNPETQTVLNVDRIRYWLGVGAQPSEKVQALLRKHGVKKPAPGEPWQLPKAEAAPVISTEPAAFVASETSTAPAASDASDAPTAAGPEAEQTS
jgi:small subunit ribosomal protein S16